MLFCVHVGWIASVEYRLAREYPDPAGYHDAIDAALFALSYDGLSQLGEPICVLGGESASSWFAIAVSLALRDKHGVAIRSQLFASCAGHDIFDLTYAPSCLYHKRSMILSSDLMQHFVEAGFGHVSMQDREAPEISSLHTDLENAPPAQFLVKNIKLLLDDGISMATKWANAGNVAVLHVVNRTSHASHYFLWVIPPRKGCKA